jgi:PST family polysaccharide transporter
MLRRGLRAIRHPVSQNALALHAVQLGNLIVPLVTLPYVSRVLGTDGFGTVSFAQGLSFLLGLIIGWGFDAWASRDVAVKRDDPRGLSPLVAQVMGARSILAASALAVAVVVYLTSDVTRGSPEFIAMAWVAAVSIGLTPTWFFLGLERLRLISTVSLVLRVVAAALTFVLVQDEGDAWIVMALFTGPAVLTAVFTIGLLFRIVDAMRPRLRPALAAIRGSAALFAGSAGLTLYTSMNVVLLGFLGTKADVANFSAAERIVRAAMQLIQPVMAAIYPRIALLDSSGKTERARRLLFTGSGLVVALAALGAAVAIVLSSEIIRLIYGPDFDDAAGVLRVLAPIMPLSAITGGAATWLMVKRRDSRLMLITLAGGILNVALSPLLVHLAGVKGMAASVLCAEAAAMTLALVATAGWWRRSGGGDGDEAAELES